MAHRSRQTQSTASAPDVHDERVHFEIDQGVLVAIAQA
jgi:hypothetical protein